MPPYGRACGYSVASSSDGATVDSREAIAQKAHEAASRAGVVLAVAGSVTLAAWWLGAAAAGPLVLGWACAAGVAGLQWRGGAAPEYAFVAFLLCAMTGAFIYLRGENAPLLHSITALVALGGLLAAPVPLDRALRGLWLFAVLAAAAWMAGGSGVRLDSIEGGLVAWFSLVALGGLQLRAWRERRTRRRLREMERLAMLDPLTGLENRRSAFSRLQHALSDPVHAGRPIALALLDLDGFKLVNDTYGHDGGDRVLLQVAAALRAPGDAAPPNVAARIGGDEFLAAWCGVGEAQAWKLAARLRNRVLAIRLDECPEAPLVDASIGVVVRRAGATPEPLDALLRRADKLMYDIKRRRRVEAAQAA